MKDYALHLEHHFEIHSLIGLVLCLVALGLMFTIYRLFILPLEKRR